MTESDYGRTQANAGRIPYVQRDKRSCNHHDGRYGHQSCQQVFGKIVRWFSINSGGIGYN